MIYELLILVGILLIVSVIAFGRDITAPAVLVNGSFFVATFCACLYADKWDFSEVKVIVVIVTGLSGFILFSYLCYFLETGWRRPPKCEFSPIVLSNMRLLVYLLVQLVIIGGTFWVIKKNVGSLSSSIVALGIKINEYYELMHNDELIYSNKWIGLLQVINFSGIYFMIYCAITNIIYKGKKQILVYINILIGVIASLITGTKTAFYMFMISAFVVFMLLKQKQSGWKIKIRMKLLLKIMLLLVILLLSFGIINNLQGRVLDEYKATDVLATYLGSPIKNLEIFIKENHVSSEVFGAQTFKYTYNDIYNYTKNARYLINNIDTYHWINSYPLGNVYTFFRAPYYDFGIVGVFLLSGLAGAFSQKIYNIAKFEKKRNNLTIVYYSYVAFSIAFSFFSNKFFESVLSKSSIYFILGFIIFELFFIKISLKKGKITIKR